MIERGADSVTASRSRVVAWALWDFGATGLNAIVITFVFSVYLTEQVGAGMSGTTTPASWLGRVLTIAGLGVALLAPATGIWVDGANRRRTALAVLTGLVVAMTSAMSLIRADYHYLWPGLVLLAATAACSDLATVPYNAMLSRISTQDNRGRISGLGSAAGYFGSVLLLLILYVGFMQGDGDTRGLLGFAVADGQHVRTAVLLTAAWFALFAMPLLAYPRTPATVDRHPGVGFLGAYSALWNEVTGVWRRDHNVVYYLLASAVFRDGLTGIFAFGAVLGVTVYGVSQADVLVFGACACIVAAIGAVAGGLLDDRVGSKPVIVGSLAAMIATGLVLLISSGALAFWVCGLFLCLFVGPTLASARALMLRMSAEGKEGVAFGLYTTAGRAASFLAPLMFFTFIDMFGADRAGMGGLCVVLAAGLLADGRRADPTRNRSAPVRLAAGSVASIGQSVRRRLTTGLTVGQRVFGLADWTRNGTLAEYVAVEARNLAPLSASVDHIVAAALPISGLTAWQGLFEHGHLATGQSALIHGAAGAVGSIAVQLAREAGARVIGSGRTEQRELVLGLGADVFLDLQIDRLEDIGEVDLVFDVIGGEILDRSTHLVRSGGALVTIAAPPRVTPNNARAVFFVVEPNRVVLATLERRLRDGRLSPIVGAVCPLDEASSAFAPAHRTRGKTITRVTDDA